MKMTIETTVQHTAGPWEITCDGAAIVGAGGGTLVAETRRAFWANLAAAAAQGSTLAERHLPQVDANARLIAAAPELLDALIEMLDASNKPANERWLSNVRSHAIAAIAKATT